jgi:protoporphyrinogen oxidase
MNIAIIGAGFTGLAAAYELTKCGQAVTIYEKDAVAGGLSSGFKAEGWDWSLERFYHHWFESDSDVLGLIREIGQGDKVLFPCPKTAVYYQGKFYALDSSLSGLFPGLPWLDKIPASGSLARGILALRFPGLSWLDKIRYGLLGLYLVLTPRWKPLERVTAHEWLGCWAGPRGYQALWEPLLVGKFGEENYRDVNMAWFWARIHKRSPRLGYFVGGFQAVADALVERVRAQGGMVHFNTAVQRIDPLPPPPPRAGEGRGGVRLATAIGEHDFDACIATVSPQQFVQLTPSLPESYRAQLGQLKSLGGVVLILALDRQLTNGFYWINLPKGEGFPFLALVEHTNYIDPQHYGGEHLVYCGDYLPPDHRYFQMSQQELLDLFLPALSRFNPAFDPSWVKRSWLFREPYTQPVPPVDHSRNIPPLATPIPGLYFASMSQVYPWDRGSNYAVELGRKVAKAVITQHMT